MMINKVKRVQKIFPNIEEVIRLAEQVDSARDRWRNEHSDKSSMERYMASFEDEDSYRFEVQELTNYLDEFNFYDAVLVECVMYIGRDEAHRLKPKYYMEPEDPWHELDEEDQIKKDEPIEEVLEYYFTNFQWQSQNAVVGQITSKGPLAQYLKDGIKILNLI